MAHYDIDVYCSKCRKYCFSHMPGEGRYKDPYVCDDCQNKKVKRVKTAPEKTAFEDAQEKLRPLAEILTALQKEEEKKGGYKLDHLLERRNRLDRLINHTSEISKKLQRPPQDLQELILCAVSIQSLGCDDIIQIAYCFGFKCSTDVKFAVMDLARLGKAEFNNQWQLAHV